jgi:hypothetical protein
MYKANLDNDKSKTPTPLYACDASQNKEETPRMVVKSSSKAAKKLKVRKRTPTSYDSETSYYLKSMFFQAYSIQKKLTKTQRLEAQKKTGLDSRKLTYWFSNHKRRSQEALEIYHDTIRRSDGQVSNYQEFLMWRRSRGLPDHIGSAEVTAFKRSKAHKKDHDQ